MANTNRYLLMVDDDNDYLDNCRIEVDEKNRTPGAVLKFDLITAETAHDARDIMQSRYIDCAIIDLRLPDKDGDSTSARTGNELLIQILDELSIPFVIHSAHSGEIEEIESGKFDIIDKEGGSFNKIFEHFYSRAEVINAMASIRHEILKETARIFHTSVYPNWKETAEFAHGQDGLEKILVRQIVAYLSEHFTLPASGAPGHHVNEFYIRPPLRTDRLHTGDLIDLKGEILVVVTPQCNIAHEYPEYILLARCDELSEADLLELRENLNGNSKQRRTGLRQAREWANQQVGISRHFLPQCDDRGPWMVNFKIVKSIASEELEKLMAGRFASISPQFVPNLIQRLASYLGRHGQPDLDPAVLAESLRK